MSRLENIKRAIEIIYNEKNGYREDLINKVGKPLVEELAKRGFISQGVTIDDENPNNFKRTWGIVAEKVEEYRRLFSNEISEDSKRIGRYLYSIGVR